MTKDKKKSIIASILVALVALSWGSSYSIIKASFNYVEPFTLMALRFTLAGIMLSLIYIKKVVNINKKELKEGVYIGVFLVGAFFCLVTGVNITTASKASFLIGSYVITVPFFAWLINKIRPDKFDISGGLLAIIGLGLLTLGSINGVNIGDFFSVICSLFFALHMIMIEKFCKGTDPIKLTVIQFWVCAISFTVLGLIFEDHSLAGALEVKYSIAYLIIISTTIAFLIQNVAQKYISSTSTALLLSLESVFGSVFAMFYLGEHMSFPMVLGGIFIFSGIILQQGKASITNLFHRK